jgi:hypothetical protein
VPNGKRTFTPDELRVRLEELGKLAAVPPRLQPGRFALAEFSQFLARFDAASASASARGAAASAVSSSSSSSSSHGSGSASWSSLEQYLEVPGQYTGLACPVPRLHKRIAGFDQAVDVMRSLKMPKKIVIRADNERVRRFAFFVPSAHIIGRACVRACRVAFLLRRPASYAHALAPAPLC